MKKRPKSGHGHGPRNSPTIAPLRPTTPKRASGNERAIKKGGAGGIPPRLFASGLSLEKAWIPRPGPGGNPPRRCQPAPVPTGPPADGNPGRAPQRALSTRTSPVGRPTFPPRGRLWGWEGGLPPGVPGGPAHPQGRRRPRRGDRDAPRHPAHGIRPGRPPDQHGAGADGCRRAPGGVTAACKAP